MRTKNLKATLVAGALFGVVSGGCGGKQDDSAMVYCKPTAAAGENLSVALGQSVTLDGSSSGYADGCQTYSNTFEWGFDAVPVDSNVDTASLTDNNTANAVNSAFIPDNVGTYVVSLVVCDIVECSDPDLIVLTVSSSDSIPTADAGPDVSAMVDERVELDGSGSYDPENAPIEYSWSLSSGPECSALDSNAIYNPNTDTPAFIPDCEGVFVVALVVTDGVSWSEPDFAAITASSTDQPPIADAGDSATLEPCVGAAIPLSGFGSYDPEGESLEYSWSLIEAPTDSTATDANFDDATLVNAKFTWDLEGAYSFQLQVFDGQYWSAPDVVTYTIQADYQNHPPVANGGGDQTVTVETDCTTSDYTAWSCEDCGDVEFELDGSGTFDPDGDTLDYEWTDIDGGLSMTGAQTTFATATVPSQSSEYDVTVSESFNVSLEVEDCMYSDTDSIVLTVTCTGSAAN
jgi:hypothetical protein